MELSANRVARNVLLRLVQAALCVRARRGSGRLCQAPHPDPRLQEPNGEWGRVLQGARRLRSRTHNYGRPRSARAQDRASGSTRASDTPTAGRRRGERRDTARAPLAASPRGRAGSRPAAPRRPSRRPDTKAHSVRRRWRPSLPPPRRRGRGSAAADVGDLEPRTAASEPATRPTPSRIPNRAIPRSSTSRRCAWRCLSTLRPSSSRQQRREHPGGSNGSETHRLRCGWNESRERAAMGRAAA